jgi:hypothetical protein
MTDDVDEILERLEEVADDGDQTEISDVIAELTNALDSDSGNTSSAISLAAVLRRKGLQLAADLAEELEELLEYAPSDGQAAEDAEEELRELAQQLHKILTAKQL